MTHKTKISTHFPYKKELLEQIKKVLPLHSVYVISVYKETKKQEIFLSPPCINPEKFITYTLLIISHKPISINLGEFIYDLYNNMQQQCKVYPIVYSLSDVLAKLDYGNAYLNRIVTQTKCLYQENDALAKFSGFRVCFHKSIYEQIQTEWNCRMERANYLLSIIDTNDIEEDPTSKLAVMHDALEQICAALLYIFWEFKPHYYSLPYLLHLCSHFTQLPQTVFPKKAFKSQRMFYILCNAHQQMRESQNELSVMDADKAYKLSERFYRKANNLGIKQLEHLKELHYQSTNLQ
ncbi:MAG: hypothetical protein A3F91_06870 [Flavobacteria bacterium RIFCSPLOWO2_12_FULL_35_11]|nr:MAG: hypothetical protein A3F91_06870 [Flavobacteria bacterium RIFCSPLOWO2_12_FULL_35_11]